mmetsp:Transcript_1852/g.3338  ORF Transcript_1852/g.3338 Transcript_1852/m.3338 type:complete len:870 (-) Transcript_1852:931-3540(-)|eukprot:CAMPEP_0176483110 /NCGR_PEP_ID=MMETSP0200_2-20121128/3747_1 /TAXON_ID=947934 /ORGANISM="Chaetoceros sp., Strain GSL56" /LENGTH=869 /DNA_ID=CAMNT_0017879497 /DNA_START=165 /DNA_END=2774 /DNA_ORIENTATION=-
MPPKRKKLKRSVPTPPPPPPEPQIVTTKPLSLILTSEKRRGLYECDYCRTDLSQVPRICCAICPEFDLCLECFIKPKASDAASAKQLSSTDSMRHDDTHGYRVCDSTRFFMFPSLRGVEKLTDANRDRRIDESSTVGSKMTDIQTGTVSDTSKSHDLDKDSKPVNNECVMHDRVGNESIDHGDVTVTLEENIEHKKDAIESGEVIDGSESTGESRTDTANQHEISVSQDISSQNDDIDMADETAPNEGGNNVPATAPESKGTEEPKQNEPKYCSDKSSFSNEHGSKAVGVIEHIVTDDIKNMWTVEEDLRLLDAITHLGLGNWVDISEEVAGASSVNNKTPKKCMERYLYDYLGKYGHILPQYTLVEVGNNEIVDSHGESKIDGSNSGEIEKFSSPNGETEIDGSKDKIEKNSSPTKEPTPIHQVNLDDKSNLFKANSNKLYKIVPTTSLPGYNKMFKKAYIPPVENVNIGDDVGRDLALKAEQTFMKLTSSASNQSEADAIKKDWETKVNTHGGPTVLPPRPEDVSAMQGSSLAGYMPRRGDFDIEWDNDAEKYLQDMEFSQYDTTEDRELKIKVIKIYNAHLDERERRKQFLIDRGLLDYRKKYQEDNKLPSDERDLKNRMRLVARFQTPKEHDALIQDLLQAKRLRKEIARLQMYRRMGFVSIVDAEKFELDRNRREAHRLACKEWEKQENAFAAKEVVTDGFKVIPEINGSYMKQYRQTSTSRQKRNSNEHNEVSQSNENGSEKSIEMDDEQKQSNHDANVNPEKSVTNVPTKKTNFDIHKCPGHELLSKKELGLCQKLRLPPKLFIETKEKLIKESLEHGLLEEGKSTRRSIFKIDVQKKADTIDFMLQPCWLPDMPHGTDMRK